MGYKTMFEQIKTVCAWNSLSQTIILVLSSSVNLSDKHLNKKSNLCCCHRDIEKVGKSKTMRIA